MSSFRFLTGLALYLIIRRSDVDWLRSDFSPADICFSYSLTSPPLPGDFITKLAPQKIPSLRRHWLRLVQGAASSSHYIRKQRWY